jgi:hypothetical protein
VGVDDESIAPQNVWWKKEKNANILCRVSTRNTRQSTLCRVLKLWNSTKKQPLLSVNAWRSAKITIVSYRRLLTSLCRVSSFAECLTLGKEVFAECLAIPSVLLSVNVIVTESVTLSSAALSKEFFTECPTKSTRRSVERSPNSRIPVLNGGTKTGTKLH